MAVGVARLLPLLVLTAAAPPDARAALDRGFVCPERLRDDDARILAVRRFVEHYGELFPQSRTGERLAYRETLLAKHRCQPETLHHDVPER